MSTQSENMMGLLKELALLKELDGKSETEPQSDVRSSDLEAREHRRQEITTQIKALGETSK